MEKKQMKFRRLLTIILIIDFAIVLLTGILLLPFMGTFSSVIEILIRKIHTITGIIMGILTILHIWIEFKFMKFLKEKKLLSI